MCIRDRYGDMDMAEEFVRFLVGDALANSAEEVEFLTRFVDKGLWERQMCIRDRYSRMPFSGALKEAISRSAFSSLYLF